MRKHTKEHRAKHVRALTGRDPIYSPYVTDLLVHFDTEHERWFCCNPRNKRRKTTHANAVYEHFYGPVPKGLRVHHKNHDPSLIEHDRLDNLMLLPENWNLRFFPVLAQGFEIPEVHVTEAYLKILRPEKTSKELFRDLCFALSQR